MIPKCKCKPFDSHFEFQHEQRKIVTCSDSGSTSAPKYLCKNTSKDYLSKYRVDGGLINDAGAKCDFLILNCNKHKSFFIELKVSDIIRAIEQIDRSIDLLKDNLDDFSVFARIVLTRVNTIELKDIKYLKLEKKVKQLNGDIIQQTRRMEEVN